jgi:hypothetical protein
MRGSHVGILAVLIAALVLDSSSLLAHPDAHPRQQPVNWGRFDGFVHLDAYHRAYPDRVGEPMIRNGDWAVQVNGFWFYWANGRLLPAKARRSWERYAPMRLYEYQRGRYRVPAVAEDREEFLAKLIDRDPGRVPRRHNGFHGLLYGALSNGQAQEIMEYVVLFGRRVKVHPMVVEPLQRVDAEARALARINSEVALFLRRIARIDGQNWRRIAGTRTLSYHSYGVAVDLIPSRYRGRFSYWRWAAQSGVRDWWELRPDQRWLVPEKLVEIFERNGFIWGGRWLMFDAIHFEYRPEILLINELANPEEPALPASFP